MNGNKKIQKMTGCAMLGAIAGILMFFNFSMPFMPSFIKLDFADVPALLASFAYGPTSGVIVCLIKNLINLLTSSTGGVGELSNFILSSALVVPAGILYQKNKNKKNALIGATIGAILMSLLSVISNYYIVYPIYTLFMPMEAIMGMYQAILPSVENLWQALIIFNMPFTFLKAILSLTVVSLIYKPMSPILHNKK